MESILDDRNDLRKISKLYKTLETDKFIYLIFEQLPLDSLMPHMKKIGSYTEKEIASTIKQLLVVISNFHSHNRIQRDAK